MRWAARGWRPSGNAGHRAGASAGSREAGRPRPISEDGPQRPGRIAASDAARRAHRGPDPRSRSLCRGHLAADAQAPSRSLFRGRAREDFSSGSASAILSTSRSSSSSSTPGLALRKPSRSVGAMSTHGKGRSAFARRAISEVRRPPRRSRASGRFGSCPKSERCFGPCGQSTPRKRRTSS